MEDEETVSVIEDSLKRNERVSNSKILPLYIPTILANVLEYLPVADLKSSRLVSHQWAEEGGKLLARKTNICFQKEADVESFLQEESQKKNQSKAEKLTLLSTVSTVRFTNFQFRIGDKWDDYYYTIKSPECEKFFIEMGSSIIGLEIKRGVWKPAQLDDSFFAKLPNLEFFKLNGRVEAPEDTKAILNTEVQLSPSIQTFEISLYPLDDTPHFARSYFEILLLRMPNLSKIKGSLVSVASTDLVMWVVNSQAPLQFLSQLEVQIEVNESEVLSLQNRNFPLTHLEMTINPGIRFGGLWTFFSSLGTTLEDLKLDLRIRSNQPDIFPCSKDMKKLKKLSLRWFDGSLSFVQDLPMLERLDLEDSNLSSGFREECDPHPNLRSFKTINCSSSAGRFAFDNVYKNLVKFFPNLRVLQMDYLSDPALRIIFDGLPKLEEFIAFQGIYTDEGVLGMSPKGFENEQDKCCPKYDSDNSKQSEHNEDCSQKRKPNLTQLQKLRILALDSPRLTDATVNYGLMPCKEIKSLVLASPNITDNAVRAIVDNMDLYYLQFRSEYQVSRKMIRYARDKMKANGRLLFFSCNM